MALSLLPSAVLALVCCFHVNAYNISVWETTIINPFHPGKKIPLLIHYPTPNTVEEGLPSAATAFPLIVFNHGGDCKNTWYDYVWRNLVPQGYIVAAPGMYEHPWIWEYEYSAAQRYTLDWLRINCGAQNASCPLYGMVGEQSIASGHSMGGGASFLSISNFNHYEQPFVYEFDAAFTLSGCDNRYDELVASLKQTPLSKILFIMSGSHDCICPPPHNSDVFYDVLPDGVCKFLADIQNGTHCHFEEASFIGMEECEAAEFIFCPLHDRKKWNLKPAAQYAFVNEYMTMFVNATMNGATNMDTVKLMQNKLDEDFQNGRMSKVAYDCT